MTCERIRTQSLSMPLRSFLRSRHISTVTNQASKRTSLMMRLTTMSSLQLSGLWSRRTQNISTYIMFPNKHSRSYSSSPSPSATIKPTTASELAASCWPVPDPKFSRDSQYDIKDKSSHFLYHVNLKNPFSPFFFRNLRRATTVCILFYNRFTRRSALPRHQKIVFQTLKQHVHGTTLSGADADCWRLRWLSFQHLTIPADLRNLRYSISCRK